MLFYVFPFGKVPRNSRVVLYAAGSTGAQYYNQVKESKYCDIVLWVDKRADGKTIKKPEAIKALAADDYDYVVIAIAHASAVAQIRETLIGYDVAESKIIHEISSFQSCLNKSSLTAEEFLHEKGAMENALIDYFYESEGDIAYFELLTDKIKRMINSDDEGERTITKRQIENKTHHILTEVGLTVEAKIVFLYIMLASEYFSKYLMQSFVDLASQITDNLSLKYWLVHDLGSIMLYYPDSVYDGYYAEMNSLKQNLARELNRDWNPPAYKKEGNRSICVVTNVAPGGGGASWYAFTSPLIRALSSRGFKVHMVDAPIFRDDSATGIVKPFLTTGTAQYPSAEELAQYYPENTEFHFCKNAMMKDRIQDQLDTICKINPLCILEMSSEYTISSYYYYQNYPTIYFNMRTPGYATQSFFHRYALFQSPEHIAMNPPIEERQALRLPLYRECAKPKRVFRRDEYGLVEGDVVVVTAGNRLPFDVSDEMADQMCMLLRSDKRIRWVLVGCSNLPYVKTHHKDLINKSIIFINYETDVPGLYGICDIYLDPSRTGNGTLLVWAIQQGLAVVIARCGACAKLYLRECDCVPTVDYLVPRVKELSQDAKFLKRQKESSVEIASGWCNDIDYFTDKLIEGINELAEEFEEGKL